MVIEYTEELCEYGPEVLTRAMRRAWKTSPVWFPPLGIIVECCEAVEKTLRVPESHHLEEENPDWEKGREKVRSIVKRLAGKMGLD